MTTSKTVRLDDRVIKYIEAYRGDNFSDKLRNYVLEHEERRDQIVDDWNRLQAQVSDKHSARPKISMMSLSLSRPMARNNVVTGNFFLRSM